MSTRIKKIDNTNYIIKDWDMKIKQKNSKMILPKLKMKDLIFSEKVINENKESQNIALIDEKILTIYLNKPVSYTHLTLPTKA